MSGHRQECRLSYTVGDSGVNTGTFWPFQTRRVSSGPQLKGALGYNFPPLLSIVSGRLFALYIPTRGACSYLKYLGDRVRSDLSHSPAPRPRHPTGRQEAWGLVCLVGMHVRQCPNRRKDLWYSLGCSVYGRISGVFHYQCESRGVLLSNTSPMIRKS